MRILLVLALLAVIVLFFLGLLAPKRSRRAQRRVERPLAKAERKSDRRAGHLGDWTNSMLAWVRRMLAKSADAGRSTRDKLSG